MDLHRELLDALGGKDVVIPALAGRDITVSPDNYRKWNHNGIPHKYRPAIAEIAIRSGVAVPKNFLMPEAR